MIRGEMQAGFGPLLRSLRMRAERTARFLARRQTLRGLSDRTGRSWRSAQDLWPDIFEDV